MRQGAAKPGFFDRETVTLEQYEPNRFRLVTESLTYTDSTGTPHTITSTELNERGTDLASVPSALWWFVASYGRQTRAALLHDALVRRPDTPLFRRSDSDWVFRDALWASNVPVLRRGLMWTAVSLETTFLTRLSGAAASNAIREGQLAAVVLALHAWVADGEWLSWGPLLVGALILGLGLSVKRAGAALLVDQIALIVGTFWFWWAGEQPLWEFGVFTATAASWLLWKGRAPWLVLGLLGLVPAAALVIVVRAVIAALEYVATPISNVRRFIAWKLGERDDAGEDFVWDETEGAFRPTREI